MKPAFAILLLLAPTLLAGCSAEETPVPATTSADEPVDRKQVERFERFTARLPQNFTLPGQALLPVATVWYNGTLDTGFAGVEGSYDQGGTHVGTMQKLFDVSDRVAPGRAAEVRITLTWQNQPGSNADLDIFVDFPGHRSHVSEVEYYLDFTRATKRTVVNVAGASGGPAVIGVEAANGVSQGIAFSLRAEYRYAKDVLVPGIPLGFHLPVNATGIILSSEKVGGDEHVEADFVIIGPDDLPVGVWHYNDIGIPTESIYVPLPKTGQYVFYAHRMHGGFLSMIADAGLPDNNVTALRRVVERIEGGAATPGDGETRFTPTPFPLDLIPMLAGAGSVTADVNVTVESQRGVVAWYHRVGRVDQDADNTVGYSGDRANTFFDASRLAPGEYTLKWTGAGAANANAAVDVVTYAR